jgi:hypothetical protein
MSTSEDNPNPIPGTSPADLEQIHDARMTARQLAYVQMVGRAKGARGRNIRRARA